MIKFARGLALATAAVALTGFTIAAEAAPRGHHHHRGGPYLRYYYSPVVPVYPLASNCGYYHRMWKRTGRYYWKAKYYDCMDW